MLLLSKSADPDKTRRRRRGGWSGSTLFAYVWRSLFAWRWSIMGKADLEKQRLLLNKPGFTRWLYIYNWTNNYSSRIGSGMWAQSPSSWLGRTWCCLSRNSPSLAFTSSCSRVSFSPSWSSASSSRCLSSLLEWAFFAFFKTRFVIRIIILDQ